MIKWIKWNWWMGRHWRLGFSWLQTAIWNCKSALSRRVVWRSNEITQATFLFIHRNLNVNNIWFEYEVWKKIKGKIVQSKKNKKMAGNGHRISWNRRWLIYIQLWSQFPEMAGPNREEAGEEGEGNCPGAHFWQLICITVSKSPATVPKRKKERRKFERKIKSNQIKWESADPLIWLEQP